MAPLVPVQPADNNYPGLDRGFNERFILKTSSDLGTPGIYVARTADDVVDVLNLLHGQHGPSLAGRIRATSGGHCYENFVFEDDGPAPSTFIIDVSTMNRIEEEGDFITIEPGASNWQVQHELHTRFGVTLPGGSCYSVGSGGHIAGGGYGLLSRLHGLTVDYLAGVDVVTFDGDRFNITKGGNDDELTWAHRGGGAGNFGIVTKYYFKRSELPKSPERAQMVIIPIAWDRIDDASGFHQMLTAYQQACAAMPLQGFTLASFVSRKITNEMTILIQMVYGANSGHEDNFGEGDVGPLESGAEARQAIINFANALAQWQPKKFRIGEGGYGPVRMHGHPPNLTLDAGEIYDLPWIDITQSLNASGENRKGKYKSCNMKDQISLPEAEAMHAYLTDALPIDTLPGQPRKIESTLMQIDSYGGMVNRIDQTGPDARTAIAARNSAIKFQYQTYWKSKGTADQPDPDDEVIIAWFNDHYKAIYQAGASADFPVWSSDRYEGCYFNYPDRALGVNAGHASDAGVDVDPGIDNAMSLYFGPYVERLQIAKQTFDPANMFRFSQSIKSFAPGSKAD